MTSPETRKPCTSLLVAGALLTSILVAPLAFAAPVQLPSVWPTAPNKVLIESAVTQRVLEADETWSTSTPRFQDIAVQDGTRTITLGEIGSDNVPTGTSFIVRVSAPGGHRVLFRQANGDLLAFWSGDETAASQWVMLRATETGWEARMSAGRETTHADPALAWLGAQPAATGEGDDRLYAQPATRERTMGYAIRFETDASLFFVACRSRAPRFRVVANGEVVAEVNVPNRSGQAMLVPVDLGTAVRRRIEILADNLEFRSILVPDVRQSVFSWAGAVPAVRMLVLGDSTSEADTRAYPWVVANLLGYEVWSRQWGDRAYRVGEGPLGEPPVSAIAKDLGEVNPDVVVISGRFFDQNLDPTAFRAHVAAWFDEIRKAARPETAIVTLTPFVLKTPIDPITQRRADIIVKEARKRGFFPVNWQGWITGQPRDKSFGNAWQYVSADYTHPTEAGHVFLGSRMAEQLRKLGIEPKAQVAAVKRRQGSETGELAATDVAR